MEDVDFHGSAFQKGDKVVTWLVAGNRDEGVFDEPDRFIADRKNARRHIILTLCLSIRLSLPIALILWTIVIGHCSNG